MTKKKSDTTTTTTLAKSSDMGDWGAESNKKYAKLAGKVEYDHEAADQLADAFNEVRELNQKVRQLEQLIGENEELHQFVWHAEDGVIALHNIGDDHLGNIMMHLLRTGRAIPRSIRGEAMHRGIVIPVKVSVDWDNARKQLAIDRKDFV